MRGEHLLDVPPLSRAATAPQRGRSRRSRTTRRCGSSSSGPGRCSPDFALTEDNADAVAAICARLDGLPLAIELAAARLTLFSPRSCGTGCESRLELLGGGSRDLPARQQTLRGTIEWSYELLEDEERAVFGPPVRVRTPLASTRSKNVAGPARAAPGLDVVDRLSSLAGQEPRAPGGRPRTSRRFSMLETIREYAPRRLDEVPGAGPRGATGACGALRRLRAEQAGRLDGPERERRARRARVRARRIC